MDAFIRETLEEDKTFLRACAEYLHRWEHDDGSHSCCSFCAFVHEMTAAAPRLEKVRQFALRQPLTLPGVLLVVKYIEVTYERSAVSINPRDIVLHLMLGLCPSDTSASDSVRTHIPILIDLLAAETEQKKDFNKKLSTVLSILLTNMKHGGCFGYDTPVKSRCIYSSTGAYLDALGNKSLRTDLRQLVQPSWVVRKKKIPLDNYYGPCSYGTYQPGFEEEEEEEKAESSAKQDSTMIFCIEGEASATSSEDEKFRTRFAAVDELSSTVEKHMTVLYGLHWLCSDTPVECMETMISALDMSGCLFCSVCISNPAVRLFLV